MERKIRVGAVSYLNTKPLIYGFGQGMMKADIELINDYPSNIAAKLLSDEIDIGLVPVAIIPAMAEHHIVSDYCIGCEGEVASVCLFSDVPLEEIQTILLDYQSRTSVALLRILLKDHWKISPELVAATEDYEQKIFGRTAGLVIGDRAFKQRIRSQYIYDLGSAWKEMTGLPFVFAAWVSNKPMDKKFKDNFNKANALGLDNLDAIISASDCDMYDLNTYYTKNISYLLDAEKKKGLKEFLKRISVAVK